VPLRCFSLCTGLPNSRRRIASHRGHAHEPSPRLLERAAWQRAVAATPFNPLFPFRFLALKGRGRLAHVSIRRESPAAEAALYSHQNQIVLPALQQDPGDFQHFRPATAQRRQSPLRRQPRQISAKAHLQMRGPHAPETAFARATSRLRCFGFFDRRTFPPPLATSYWSLNPALHGGIFTPS